MHSQEDAQILAPAEMVPLASLIHGDSPRFLGEDAEHIRTLTQIDGPLPAIIVHRPTMRIIDGMHRLHAARLKGMDEIAVRFFEGDEESAFVLAVESNVTHGLPLKLPERTAAAKRILSANPLWSDRAIAQKTGLAAGTIAGIRARSASDLEEAEARLGRDGRLRPLSAASGRRMASELIRQNPDASLREIAMNSGISLSTALDVRKRVNRGDDPVPTRQRQTGHRRQAHQEYDEVRKEASSILEKMRRDPSLRYTEYGRAFLAALSAHAGAIEHYKKNKDSFPTHCVSALAKLARRYSDMWLSFADELERLARTGLAPGPEVDEPDVELYGGT